MSTAQFVDISAWQPETIDWGAYRTWAKSFDGVSRVAIRSSYGYGYTDTHYTAYRAGALEAGIDVIIYYHYAYPQYNSPAAEAQWQRSVVGLIRPQDSILLDLEEQAPNVNNWAYEWLTRCEASYGKILALYANDSYIRAYLQDTRLVRFPLFLANWQFSPTERPACPPPWTTYAYLQYTDRASIPGMPGPVDASLYFGLEAHVTEYQRAAFELEWRAVVPDVRLDSGIANAAWEDYRQGIYHGPALSQEKAGYDWGGRPILFQFTAGGRYQWEEGVAHFYPYT